jgi:hypothetical protein
MLPGGGWLVIGFITDNPGAWLMHCHIVSLSTLYSMGVLFSMGTEKWLLMHFGRLGMLARVLQFNFLREHRRLRVHFLSPIWNLLAGNGMLGTRLLIIRKMIRGFESVDTWGLEMLAVLGLLTL